MNNHTPSSSAPLALHDPLNIKLRNNLIAMWQKLAQQSDAWHMEKKIHASTATKETNDQKTPCLWMRSPASGGYFNMCWWHTDADSAHMPQITHSTQSKQDFFFGKSFIDVTSHRPPNQPCATRITLGTPLKNNKNTQQTFANIHRVETKKERSIFHTLLQKTLCTDENLEHVLEHLQHIGALFLMHDGTTYTGHMQLYQDPFGTVGLYMLGGTSAHAIQHLISFAHCWAFKQHAQLLLCPCRPNHKTQNFTKEHMALFTERSKPYASILHIPPLETSKQSA